MPPVSRETSIQGWSVPRRGWLRLKTDRRLFHVKQLKRVPIQLLRVGSCLDSFDSFLYGNGHASPLSDL